MDKKKYAEPKNLIYNLKKKVMLFLYTNTDYKIDKIC